MLSELIKKKNLFSHLYEIDKNTAKQYRQLPCPHCGGPLYFSNYLRKPRGEPEGVPEEFFIQFSLCCGTEGCRKRLQPPSCRFLGRRVYWFAVILCVLTDWQNTNKKVTVSDWSIRTGICRNTINRWLAFFEDTFPASRTWRRLRGQISAGVSNSHLPSSFINYCRTVKSNAEDTLVSSLIILSGGSKIRAG
jgi:hypothetical protein